MLDTFSKLFYKIKEIYKALKSKLKDRKQSRKCKKHKKVKNQ